MLNAAVDQALPEPAPLGRVAHWNESDVLSWLVENRPPRLAELFATADAVRRAHVGDHVHLRGLLEISNHCVRACAYCGINKQQRRLPRYRLSAAEILEGAQLAKAGGCATVVLQSGEDFGFTAAVLAHIITQIKEVTGLCVTLSLGERLPHELERWRRAGADRYLLRFETSDAALFQRLHPPLSAKRPSDRLALLKTLRRLGYEIGSGVMVGLPGQSLASLARDICLFRQLDLDMIGVGPYIPHPQTPLGQAAARALQEGTTAPPGEVAATAAMTLKVVALARLLQPEANIPATTALATLRPESGRDEALCCGANVVMPNITPMAYRPLYAIYPAKACIAEPPEPCLVKLQQRLRSIGRELGCGPGSRPR